jgi:hypothetical protein
MQTIYTNYGRELVDRHPNDLTTDEDIDLALEQAKLRADEPLISYAKYHDELSFLELRLTNGRRLLIPREDLGELKSATAEQARDLFIVPTGTAVWWPQIDDGLYLPDFLQYRWRNDAENVAA